MKNLLKIRCAIISLAVSAALLSASAADYNWTGKGDGHSWSNADNWTNAEGVPVAPVVTDGAKYSYHFPVDDTGLVVTQDMKGAIIMSTLTFERTSTAPVTVEISSKEPDCILYVGAQGTVTVPEGMTLLWKADANRWHNQDVIKNGPGKVIFEYLRSPGTQRGFVLNDGTVEVAATSADTRFHLKMGGSDLANLPVFINHKDGQVIGGLDTLRLGGMVDLDGKTLKVGAPAQMTGGTNVLPTIVADSGTLVFQNERVAKLSEMTSSFGLALDRADVVVPDFGSMAIQWLFDDATNPTRDDIGQGSRMIVSGRPAVVEDATRGSVLSFSGGAYLKGPDTDNWLDGFEPGNGYTVAFWMKPSADCNSVAKIFFLGVGADPGGRALAIRLNNSTTQGLMATAWGGNQTPTTGNLRDDKWHHVAVTYSGVPSGSGNMQLYIDGANIHSWTVSGCNPQKKDLYIGNMADTAWGSAGSGNPYTGLMDDFLLVPRFLSAKEIKSLVDNGPASIIGTPALGDFAAESGGTLAVGSQTVSLKTLSGSALAGGVEMLKDGSTLTVGTGAGATASGFRGVINGGSTTLVKKGADYALALSGTAPSVTNVVVGGGTLTLRRPHATRAGLVAYYAFDDLDELGLDSTPAGMTLGKYKYNANEIPEQFSAVDGVRGKAIHFPGGISLNANGGRKPADFPAGNDSYTVSVWIKPTAAACTGTVPICSWGDGNVGLLSLLRFNGESKIMFSNWSYDHEATGLTLSDGEWHHLVVTYDGATRTKALYYDNEQKFSSVISDNLNIGTKNNFEIGHTDVVSSRLNQYYSGDMDELMVFNYAWSAEEVAAEYNGTANIASATAPALPTPVARWTFDGADPLAAESGEAALKLSASNGEVAFESGDAICGKAARFSSTSGFLKLDTFPTDIIPTGSATFTAIVRYRPDFAQQSENNIYPAIMGWGDDGGWSAGTLFRIGVKPGQSSSARVLLRNANIESDNTYRSTLGNERTRWYTVALVYAVPGMDNVVGGGTYAAAARMFIDGEHYKSSGQWQALDIAARDFCIGSNADGKKTFYGLVDDVQIYDSALTDGQIRMITEQLEASKGKSTTETAVPASVLTAQPDVTVAQGAKLKVASVETIGTLSGAGAIEIEPLARLNVSGVNGFSGSVTGEGLVGVADNTTVEFGDGSEPVLVLDRPLALGANVTVNSSARGGKLLLAHASEFVDVENLATWTAVLPGNRQYKFEIADSTDGGKDLRLVIPSGLLIIVR